MNKPSNLLMYAAVTTVVSISAIEIAPAQAVGFSGSYDPTNFLFISQSGGNSSSGVLDTSNAPNSITMTGSIEDGNLLNGETSVTVSTAQSAVFSFNWSYSTADIDGATGERFFFKILDSTNQEYFSQQLSDDNGLLSQSGFFSISANLGDRIEWFIGSNNHGAPGQVTISNFSAIPNAVPEPFTIIGTCLGGTAAFRMRKKLISTTK
jgi:hypothetical protein